MFSITLEEALKVLALSETKSRGSPLLVQNLLRLRMNVFVDKSGTTSTLTALVVQQVYKQIQTFLLFTRPCVLMYSGPAKSSPVFEKGGASFTQNSGSGGGAG